MTTDNLLPSRLKAMWAEASKHGISSDQCALNQREELSKCALTWKKALILPGQDDLVSSTLIEIGRWRHIENLSEVRRRCVQALAAAKARWQQSVKTTVDAATVQEYYDTGDEHIEELMWWHTLEDDNSPLAYVTALELARSVGCKSYLDFGAGVGSGGLLFQQHGFAVTLADISGVLQSFCKYRFHARGRDAVFIDLKVSSLPDDRYDFITAMDVFEHLVDPVRAVDSLSRCLKPGGYLYGRFAAEDDPDRPQHIVTDFGPVFAEFANLGFREVFRDDWLWGHQAFQKAG